MCTGPVSRSAALRLSNAYGFSCLAALTVVASLFAQTAAAPWRVAVQKQPALVMLALRMHLHCTVTRQRGGTTAGMVIPVGAQHVMVTVVNCELT